MTDRREQDEREDAAALWFTRWHSQSMTAQQQRELQAWLAASLENRQAFDDMALLWREMSALPRPKSQSRHPPGFSASAPAAPYPRRTVYPGDAVSALQPVTRPADG